MKNEIIRRDDVAHIERQRGFKKKGGQCIVYDPENN